MENELIKSKLYDVKKFKKIMIRAGIIIAVIVFAGLAYKSISRDLYVYNYKYEHYKGDDMTEFYNRFGKSAIGYALSEYFGNSYWFSFRISLLIVMGIILVFSLIGIITYKAMSKISLTVTDKRVYGTATFGKRVDLPLDSVSAIALGGMKGIAVTTASGAIKFALIKNREEIYSVVSKLLVDRQSGKKVEVTPNVAPQSNSNADELKKYKDLLDSGVITQEEFDAKKKQLLGL